MNTPSLTAGNVLPFALLAALVATLCDLNHVFTATLQYPEPFLMGQSWFVFPGFALAFSIMAIVYHYSTLTLPAAIQRWQSTTPGSLQDFVEHMIAFVLVYLLSGFGNQHPALLALLFYVLFALRLAVSYDRGFILLIAILLAVGGMVGEGIMTIADLVHYRQPEILGVPWWLGGLYMHGALALRGGMRYFVYGRG